MRVALAIGAAVGVVAVVGGAGGPAAGAPVKVSHGAAAAAAYDFGDAPDGAPARYAGQPRVRGTFPSRARSGGPRHPASGPRLGTSWSGEADSRQVDADADDGTSLNPRSCTFSTLNVLVDATRAPAGTPLYLNAWFDWNQDGDWRDSGNRRCRPEWAIQNMRIDPATLGADRIAVLPLRFRAGRVPNQFWWRVQVHSGDPVPHFGSGGQATPSEGGETEDWLFSRIPPPRAARVGLRCGPGYGVIDHGRQHVMSFFLNVTAGTRLNVRRVIQTNLGDREGMDIQRKQLGKRSWMVRLTSTLKHTRDPWGQGMTVRLHVQALLNGQIKNYRASCGLAVFHVRRVVLPPPPPKTYRSAPRAIVAPKIDPVKARCRARFVPAGAAATVDVRCDGAHVRTIVVRVDRAITRYTVRGTTWPGSCGFDSLYVWRCHFRPNNRGRIIGIDYEVANTYSENVATVYIDVLAGGSETTPGGTTFVLHQFWTIDRDRRIMCRQSIPSNGDCPPL